MMSPDSFLARALLASGMLTRTQLDIALKWLEEAPQEGLGDLLCTNGVIPRVLLETLMRFYKKDRASVAPATGNRDKGVHEAQLFCLMAMRENEVSVEQLRDAVDQWVRLEGMGKPRPIGEVLMERGYLDLSRMRKVLDLTKEAALACGSCGEVDPLYKVTGAPFTCDRCKSPLVGARVRGAAAAPPPDPLVGRIFGGARLEEKIGQGRWTVVYRGIIPAQNRPVAVKLFAPDTPAASLERYLANAKAAIPIRSSSLVAVLAAGVTDGRGWIVTDLVTDAKVWPPRERMGWNRLCKVGIDLARALAVVHANSRVHGDVRPSSVFVREAGALLADCGLAHDGTLATPCDPAVTAPELWKNEPWDNRVDLYALGCTLYALSAGRPPFEDSDPRALDIAHRTAIPKPPGAYNLELPRSVGAIILKLLEKDPANRYAFAEDVARDLEAVLKGETPKAAGAQEGKFCQFCKTPNPAGEEKCLVCGKSLSEGEELLFLDGEAPCPKCGKPMEADALACGCGYVRCKKCRERAADAEYGLCSVCLTPEMAAKIRRAEAFRRKPTLGRPAAAGSIGRLKPPPPAVSGGGGLKPPPPRVEDEDLDFENLPPPTRAPAAQAGLKPPPPPARPTTSALKPPPPPAKPAGGPPSRGPAQTSHAVSRAMPAGGLKPPPPVVNPAQDEDLDFDSLPPPEKKAGERPSDDDLLGEEPAKPKPLPPTRPKTSLFDRRRRM